MLEHPPQTAPQLLFRKADGCAYTEMMSLQVSDPWGGGLHKLYFRTKSLRGLNNYPVSLEDCQ